MNELQKVFNYQEKAVRVVTKDGEPWFVAKDVCDILEIANSRDAIVRLDDDEKGVGIADTNGGKRNVTIIAESGVYALAFTSRKEEAENFRRWLRKEVLPSIRKHGIYATNELLDDPDLMVEAIERLRNEKNRNKLLQNENKLLEIENRLLSQENVSWANRKFIDALVKKYAEIKGPDKSSIQKAWTDFKKELLYKHSININLRINSCVGRMMPLRPLNAIRDDEITVAISTMVSLCKQNNVDISEVIKNFDIGF